MRSWSETPRTVGLAVVLAAILLVGSGCTTPSPAPPTPAEVKIAGSVVSTAGSTNEMEVVVPPEVAASWTALGATGSGVELVQTGGDGTVYDQPADLTGDAAGQITALLNQINGFDAEVSGRAALAGLDAIKSPAGAPVWVFSPLLDTKDPLDFAELAFREPPGVVMTKVQKAGKLPVLQGRDVTFVVTPAAGAQKKLSTRQVGYQRAIWGGIARAAGANSVKFFVGTGTTIGAGTIDPIAIPAPPR